jgi:hypothetical protein
MSEKRIQKTQTASSPLGRLHLADFLLAECIKHQAHPVRDSGLFKDAKNVVLYRVFAQMQSSRYLSISKALSHKASHFLLAMRQRRLSIPVK